MDNIHFRFNNSFFAGVDYYTYYMIKAILLNQVNVVWVISQGNSSNLKSIKYKVSDIMWIANWYINLTSKYFYAATLMNNSYMLCLNYLMPIHMAALIVIIGIYVMLEIGYFRDWGVIQWVMNYHQNLLKTPMRDPSLYDCNNLDTMWYHWIRLDQPDGPNKIKCYSH